MAQSREDVLLSDIERSLGRLTDQSRDINDQVMTGIVIVENTSRDVDESQDRLNVAGIKMFGLHSSQRQRDVCMGTCILCLAIVVFVLAFFIAYL